MEKICINGRDELLILDLTKIACFKADTDYTKAYYMSGLVSMLPMGLNKIENVIAATVPKSLSCDFVRVGRSYIINQAYLYRIQVLHQKLILSDGIKLLTLPVTKEALKRYKQYIHERYTKGSSTNQEGSPQKA